MNWSSKNKMNSLQNMLESLAMVSGPLGPMVSLDEREADQTDWCMRRSIEDLPQLVEILKLAERECSIYFMDSDEAKQVVARAMALLAESHAEAILGVLATLVQDPIAEVHVYQVLQEWDDPLAIPLLENAVKQVVDADLAIEVACALGINQGRQRLELLHRLSERFPGHLGLQNEVQIALGQG
jgi:hypothetical protein